jgi:ketosteroid isomerase-like protein
MFRKLAFLAAVGAASASAAPADDEKIVAQLDREYQYAVKMNDVATIERIHADDMILVTGRGAVFRGKDIEDRALRRAATYEQQDEVEGTQKVRVWGDTAVVTALLWLKGTDAERGAFDYKLWFSDTYVRINGKWRYVFGQASLAVPKES